MRKKTAAIHSALDIDTFKNELKNRGLKATPQRVAVHEAMLALIHASADMVAEHISVKGAVRITPTSVYNILSGMADLGIYTRRLSMENKMWFDVNSFRHIHAYDAVNGTFIDLMDENLLKSVEDSLKRTKFRGFKTERIDIQFICHPSKKAKIKKI